jgi:tol-pal system protein YbgF
MTTHSLHRKIFPAGILAALVMLSSCASTSDINRLRSQIYYQEQRIAQLEAGLAQAQPAQANSWAEISSMRSELARISGQVDDLRRTQETQDGLTQSTLNAKVQDLERRTMFMASQLGVTFEELPPPTLAPTTAQPALSPAPTDTAALTPPPSGDMTAASVPPAPPAPPAATAPALQEDLYQKALEQFYATNYKQAQTMWAEFVKGFPNDSLVSNALFWQGECYFQMQDYANAVLTYQQVIEKHKNSPKYEAALLKQGIAFFKLKKDQAGKLVLQDLIKKYPNSAEAKRAQAYLKGGN